MNTSVRFSIAVLVSILAHAILLMWAMHQVKVRAHDNHGLLQVFLPQYTNDHSRQPLLQLVRADLSAINKLADEQVRQSVETASPSQAATRELRANGHFRWQPPPAYQQEEVMNAMQLSQLAHQRELRVAAVLTGLSNLSAQLGPVTTQRIVCTQQMTNEIDCTPEPGEETRPLLAQFFSLALESHRLGIAGNPVQMDFGAKRGVSVTLLR